MKKELLFALIILCSVSVFAANCGGSTPCSCGDTLTSSRTLTASDSLTGCGGVSALYMNPISSLVLDCEGFTISGTASRGIEVFKESNVDVKNCVIDGFSFGMFLNSGRNGEIINNTFSNIGTESLRLVKSSGWAWGSDNNLIVNNTFSVDSYVDANSVSNTFDNNRYLWFDEISEGCTGIDNCNEIYNSTTGNFVDYSPVSFNGQQAQTPELNFTIIALMAVLLSVYVITRN